MPENGAFSEMISDTEIGKPRRFPTAIRSGSRALALLTALTLTACKDPHPDVSAHTILNLLVQTEARPEAMQPALGSLYEGVTLALNATHPETGIASILYRLSRDGAEKATLRCDTLFHSDHTDVPGWGALETPKMQAALRAPWAMDTRRRAHCIFTYIDTHASTQAFKSQAEIWTEHQIGPLEPDSTDAVPDMRIASNPDKTIFVSLTQDGPPKVGYATLRIRMDLSTP